MDPAEKKRKIIIGGVLIATLIAVVLVEEEEDYFDPEQSTVQPTASTSSTSGRVNNRASQPVPDYLAVEELGQRQFDAKAGDLFKTTSWLPPRVRIDTQQAALARQQAASRIAAAPTPVAPPLQFTYIGKAISDNETLVFLSQAGENLVAKLGTNIDEQYRVDAMDEETVTFTYLPLGAKQTLMINEKKAGSFR